MKPYTIQWTQNSIYDLKQIFQNQSHFFNNTSINVYNHHKIFKDIVANINMFPKMYDSIKNHFNITVNSDYRIAFIDKLSVIYYVNENQHVVTICMVKNDYEDIKDIFNDWLNHEFN